MKPPSVKLRHRLEYGAFWPIMALLRALPAPLVRHFGAALGELVHHFDRRHRSVALNNLELVLPELAPAERRRVTQSTYRHIGRVLGDLVATPRCNAVELCRRVTLEGWEHVREVDRSRGLFMLSAHLGCWEVLPHLMALYLGPSHIVARPLDNPLLDRELRALRERFGATTINKRGAARGMLRAAGRGDTVVILIDQRVHPNEGVEVPFFGQPAMTTPLLARLSLRTGAPVVPLFCFPEPGGRFLLKTREPIEAAGSGPEAVEELTARYLAVIEEEIRQRPEMWLWMHERWLWIDGHKRWRKRRSRSIP